MPGPLHRFFSADHRRLDELLRRSLAGAGAIDLGPFGAFRAGLLRHIGMEESPHRRALSWPRSLRFSAHTIDARNK
jgi:hypothetical protein